MSGQLLVGTVAKWNPIRKRGNLLAEGNTFYLRAQNMAEGWGRIKTGDVVLFRAVSKRWFSMPLAVDAILLTGCYVEPIAGVEALSGCTE